MKKPLDLGCTVPSLCLVLACSGPGGYAGSVGTTSGTTDATSPDLSGSGVLPAPADLPSPTTGLGAATTTVDATSETGPGTTGGAGDTSTGATSGDVAACGNGVLDPGEGCDESYGNNSDHGSCTLQCQPAKCGDGLVWAGHENCDQGADNNDTKYGACTTACTWGARCNDGAVQKPEEECDLGPLNNTGESPQGGVACTGCRFVARQVFLSSAGYTAKQLGGLGGADLRCQQLANAAGFDNAPSFRAWLSAGQGSPDDRFEHGAATVGVPYVLPDGRRIADDWDDLVAHGPDDGITITESGTELLDVRVWTNTDANGEVFDADNDCDNWTSDSFLLKTRVGRSGVDKTLQAEWNMWVENRQWTSYLSLECKKPLQIYCFEQ